MDIVNENLRLVDSYNGENGIQYNLYSNFFNKDDDSSKFDNLIKDPKYNNYLFIFNDSIEDYENTNVGGGNAIVRPYKQNLKAWGIPTGQRIKNLGFTTLIEQVELNKPETAKGYIDTAQKDIIKTIGKRKNNIPVTNIIYSGNKLKSIRINDKDIPYIDNSIFKINDTVLQYITTSIFYIFRLLDDINSNKMLLSDLNYSSPGFDLFTPETPSRVPSRVPSVASTVPSRASSVASWVPSIAPSRVSSVASTVPSRASSVASWVPSIAPSESLSRKSSIVSSVPTISTSGTLEDEDLPIDEVLFNLEDLIKKLQNKQTEYSEYSINDIMNDINTYNINDLPKDKLNKLKIYLVLLIYLYKAHGETLTVIPFWETKTPTPVARVIPPPPTRPAAIPPAVVTPPTSTLLPLLPNTFTNSFNNMFNPYIPQIMVPFNNYNTYNNSSDLSDSDSSYKLKKLYKKYREIKQKNTLTSEERKMKHDIKKQIRKLEKY